MICPVADERMCPISVMPKSRAYIVGQMTTNAGMLCCHVTLEKNKIVKNEIVKKTNHDAMLLLRAPICLLLSRSRRRVSTNPNVTLLLFYANYELTWENPNVSLQMQMLSLWFHNTAECSQIVTVRKYHVAKSRMIDS